jgi:uncharacterized protein (TIGR00369 family)
MMIWKQKVDPGQIHEMGKHTMVDLLGIEIIDVGEDYLTGRMPVDRRTIQPMGLLHGGASVVLAETLGSVAANLCVDPDRFYCVGLEVNANHLMSVKSGFVYGTARSIHIGKRTQVWEIRISDPQGKPVCISRLTLAVVEKNLSMNGKG